jgi:hypothetical protein
MVLEVAPVPTAQADGEPRQDIDARRYAAESCFEKYLIKDCQ